jgi:hypothetical protein
MALSHPWRWRWGEDRTAAQRQIAALTRLLAPHIAIVGVKRREAFEEWLPGAAAGLGVSTSELRALLGWLAAEEAASAMAHDTKLTLVPDAEQLGRARALMKSFRDEQWEKAGRPKGWWQKG